MFEVFDSLSYRGRPFSQYRYFVHGQVCVDKAFRGSGLFDRMFEHYRQVYSPHFDFVVTEIAARNERSLRAHERVGFEVVHSYVDPTLDETWRVVVWDFRSPASKAP
jgi:RimJ/RimL family protein N-acetyltransferase